VKERLEGGEKRQNIQERIKENASMMMQKWEKV
jgi:hypothetical protein